MPAASEVVFWQFFGGGECIYWAWAQDGAGNICPSGKDGCESRLYFKPGSAVEGADAFSPYEVHYFSCIIRSR